MAVTIVGQAAESIGLQRRYQANTIRKHRVLSLFVLGLNLLYRKDDWIFKEPDLKASMRIIKGKITCLS
jgi:hypothetical protein